jgi:hypothetical protein
MGQDTQREPKIALPIRTQRRAVLLNNTAPQNYTCNFANCLGTGDWRIDTVFYTDEPTGVPWVDCRNPGDTGLFEKFPAWLSDSMERRSAGLRNTRHMSQRAGACGGRGCPVATTPVLADASRATSHAALPIAMLKVAAIAHRMCLSNRSKVR